MVHNDNEWRLWIRFLVLDELHMPFFFRPPGEKKTAANNLVPKLIIFCNTS